MALGGSAMLSLRTDRQLRTVTSSHWDLWDES